MKVWWAYPERCWFEEFWGSHHWLPRWSVLLRRGEVRCAFCNQLSVTWKLD